MSADNCEMCSYYEYNEEYEYYECMMNLDEDVVVARIAKVKDKVEGESDDGEVTEDDENI